MADVEDLYFVGDDFDAVLAILEDEEELEEQFTRAVDSVSIINALFGPKIVYLAPNCHCQDLTIEPNEAQLSSKTTILTNLLLSF